MRPPLHEPRPISVINRESAGAGIFMARLCAPPRTNASEATQPWGALLEFLDEYQADWLHRDWFE